MNTNIIDHLSLYRLPWNLADNAISWLEPTSACNLACDGCYRENLPSSHKSLDVIKRELDILQQKRNSDCISIAGGDPLMHPEIIDIIIEISKRGFKPIVNTNGVKLELDLLKELKKSGVFGFTFHVDSKQGRAGKWRNKNELELNDLRYEYAKLLKDVGGISCSFNATVYEDTLRYVPDLVEWAHKNIDKVQTMVFIAFRHVVPDMPFDWYADSEKVNWQEMKYHSDQSRKVDILSTDMLEVVKQIYPDFEPLAFLNGTDKVDSYKWLLTERIGNRKKVFGYLGPKFIELVMSFYHFTKGTYLSYISPKESKMGRSALFLLWPFDKKLRKSLKNFLRNPFNIFNRTYLQSILFIQPVDFSPTGNQNMCDGCPDITVWNDDIVWSCRLEELKSFGTFLRSVTKVNGKEVKI